MIRINVHRRRVTSYRELAASAGINMVLAKPVTPGRLLQLLAEIVCGRDSAAG